MLKVAAKPPIWYRVAANLPVGRDRIFEHLDRRHKLDRLVKYPFYDGTVIVSLRDRPRDLSKYQHVRISAFVSACNKYLENFDFIDCGANTGLFSAQFSIFSRQVRMLTAIEPNPAYFELLQENIVNACAEQIECVNAAVSDFEGRGRLVEPNGYPGPSHAMFIVNDPAGDIPVTTLRTVLSKMGPRVAIKLDIEGAEVPTLQGAADAIRALKAAVLFLEVHGGVLDRIGMSDVEMLAAIEEIRPFTWINSSDGAQIDPRYPVLQQTMDIHQCDLIGITANSRR